MSKSRLFSTARKEAGFTLIELLTVIVIIGILAAIAIPVFTSQRARAQDSQTVSDVRNIAVQAETIMSDPKSTYDDVTKANIDFASSKNVSWNISGSASLGGYCIVAKNTAGKKYTTDATALTYDSLAGGVGQTGKACSGANLPVPNGSTGVGSLVAVNAPAPTGVSVNRNSQTSATVNWTIPTDTTVTGYVVQRATTNNDASFATVGTVDSRTTSSFTDTSAPSTAAYYRVYSKTASGTSITASNTATVSQYVPATTYNATGTGSTGSLQTFSVTDTGTYKVEAWGAQGGTNGGTGLAGGSGAYAAGVFSLNAGQNISILVGQAGAAGTNGASFSGGGGGTFVNLGSTASASNLLVAAGGGGGGSNVVGQNGSTGTAGLNSNNQTGGVNGGGGAGWYSGGGGGYLAAGENGSTRAGGAFPGNGASTNFYGDANPAAGGYGGGGAGGYAGSVSGAGGGGYSGGAGGQNAGGGGSYVAASFNGVNVSGTELNNTTKANAGQGKVVITRIN